MIDNYEEAILAFSKAIELSLRTLKHRTELVEVYQAVDKANGTEVALKEALKNR